jgi:tyrosine-protein phosphatase SIW14
MMNRPGRIRVVSFTLLLIFATFGVPLNASTEELLPNFHKVNEKLYRGGQPSKGAMKELAALGIKTVVNLRGEDEETRAEALEARAAGLRYHSEPLPVYRRPNKRQVERVLSLIKDPQNWPVFVHCRHGEDRTGVIIAAYRISREGWSSEAARKEAKRYGMSRFQFAMKDYINDYARDYKTGHR